MSVDIERVEITNGPGARRDRPNIGVVVVAYNAASTLAWVLDRVPESAWESIAEIVVLDDCSSDATYLVGLGYQHLRGHRPITVLRNPKNLGYGGNQKAGYRYAIEHGLEVVVLLHGDGQYAPECLERVVEPIVEGRADAVIGSRMLEAGAARKGGMPLYKYFGNRVLSSLQRRLIGLELSEFHSGYRAYRTSVLAEIGLDELSDDYDFDTEVLIRLHDHGARIEEVPIPTYYGDEICYVNGIRYALQVTEDSLRYALDQAGFGERARGRAKEYAEHIDRESHRWAVPFIEALPPGARVLDLGCGRGALSRLAAERGLAVTAVDCETPREEWPESIPFVQADLDAGLPEAVGTGFDLVLALDVLEHLRDPLALLQVAEQRLAPGGRVIVSLPNICHWYSRLRIVLGRFDYDWRGPLDEGHLRFFSERSVRRLVRAAGLRVVSSEVASAPPVLRGLARRGEGAIHPLLASVLAARLFPGLFGYQFLLELTPLVAADPDRRVSGVLRSHSPGRLRSRSRHSGEPRVPVPVAS